MKALRKIHYLSIILAFVLVAAVVVPALATPPEFNNEVIDYTGPLDNPCGIDISVHVFGTLRWQYFFDNNGALTRFHAIYGTLKQTWSANGKSLNMQISGPIQFTVLSETVIIVSFKGTNETITVPGYGHVYGSMGNVSYKMDTTTEPWTLIEVVREKGTSVYDWDPICAYLAP
jgi:hypothetical protein